jgi:hypothetical protein
MSKILKEHCEPKVDTRIWTHRSIPTNAQERIAKQHTKKLYTLQFYLVKSVGAEYGPDTNQ